MRRLLINSFHSIAQTSNLGSWLIYFGNKSITKQWDRLNKIQYRNYNTLGNLGQLLIRTGAGYNLTENKNNLLLGYTYILSQNYIDFTNDKIEIGEHRVFQQFISRQTISRVALQNRNRLYAGLGYAIPKTIRLEIGYMNQFLPARSNGQINIISFINF